MNLENLTAADLVKLTAEEKEELLLALEAKEQMFHENKLKYYTPYKKQSDFHRAGSIPGVRERLLMAGNQCLSPWTLIETDSSTVPAGTLVGGKGGRVRALVDGQEGSARSSGWFLRGIEPAYRVVLDTGLWFDCSAEHQVWNGEDYVSLAQLVSGASGLHSFETHEDYLASCVEDGYLCGPQQRTDQGSHAAQPQGSLDAHAHTLSWSSEDAEARTPSRIHLYLNIDLQSTVRDAKLISVLCAQFAVPALNTPSLQLSDDTREFLRLVPELVDALQSDRADGKYPALSPSGRELPLCVAGRPGRLQLRLPSDAPSLCAEHPADSIQAMFQDGQQVSKFYPCDLHIDGVAVLAIVPIGYQPIVDTQVEDVNNYKAAGLFHHNCGKTLSAGAETAMHLTGVYPADWGGKRFLSPVTGWAASVSSQSTRDTCQRMLLGKPGEWGTGMIPKDSIIDIKRQSHGVPDSIETVTVRHIGGGVSRITFKSYDQGRERFQGESLDFVWLDEEPSDASLYTEALTRTNATKGVLYMTFTPLMGMSSVVKRFLVEKSIGTHVTSMTIEDADHYSAEERAMIIASYPEHERKARTEGIPMLGSGAIFPVAEEVIVCEPFRIPEWWPRIAGVDFGWDHNFACAWLAIDPDTDIIYVYDCYAVSKQTPLQHAIAITSRSRWIPVAWPHDGLQHDKGSGVQLQTQYKSAGVPMLKEKATWPDGSNSVEPGLIEMLDRMQTGRLKIFRHLESWLSEYRIYHRKDGKIVKMDDDVISATRYALMMRRFAKSPDMIGVNFSGQQAGASSSVLDSVAGY